MRKLSLLFAFLLLASYVKAQDGSESYSEEFNRWSIEIQGGLSLIGDHALADGYEIHNPNWWQASLGARYMVNEKFGFRADLGYHSFTNSRSSANEFDTDFPTISTEFVMNAGSVLGFREWSKNFNILLHGGIGYGTIGSDKPRDLSWFKDNMLFTKFGVTPQIRLSDRIALMADVSWLRSMRQDVTIDGSDYARNRNLREMSLNGSIGLTFYLGSQDHHADWHDSKCCGLEPRIDKLDDDVSKIQNDMQDSDGDGVPDYLDEEPDTPEGAIVDTKGRTVNRVPDQLREELDRRYESQGEGTIKKLINEGYVNVYFNFDSTQPERYSLEAANYLIKYLNENPDTDVELVGYADELGESDYNTKLSETRAERIKDLLIANGIDEERINTSGQGSDDSVDKDSSEARQMVRRVTFKLKE